MKCNSRVLTGILLMVISLIAFAVLWYFIGLDYVGFMYICLGLIFFYICIPMLAMGLVSFHEVLGLRIFQKAIDKKQFSLPAVSVTNYMLNFSFFTMTYLLPLRVVLCELFPALKPVESLIPTSFQELFQMSSLICFILIFSSGPVFIYTVRCLREKEATRGRKLFEFFQVLLYVSLFLVVSTCYSALTRPDGHLDSFYLGMVLVVLPIVSFGETGSLVLLEGLNSDRYHKPAKSSRDVGVQVTEAG